MVLITESRGWKNVSHISWINGVCVLCISLLNAGVFSLNIIMMSDTCGILNFVQDQNALGTFEKLIEPEIKPLLDTCLFGDGSLVNYFGIQ